MSHSYGSTTTSVSFTAVLVVLVLAIVSFGGFAVYKVLAPAQEEVRREVFENSTAYIQGTRRDVENLRLEYLRAEEGSLHRSALRSTILSRVAEFDLNELSPELREFITTLKQEESS